MRSSEQEEISPDEDQPLKTVRPHKKYGKMIVFCEKPFFICLGPDCRYLDILRLVFYPCICDICGRGLSYR